ncbi:MAG: glutaminyl-peptide cyclotransferase [Phycisphaerales bacterium]|nr:glutaminyl-peptide cyclotransferase [Phycisphaerales bacterium]
MWTRYRIARISPATGQVLSWIDISGLLSPLERLLYGSPNGIAYDAQHDRIFVTGKRWPSVFEIRVQSDASAMRSIRLGNEHRSFAASAYD